MYCSRCGTANADGSRFCKGCGSPLNGAAAVNVPIPAAAPKPVSAVPAAPLPSGVSSAPQPGPAYAVPAPLPVPGAPGAAAVKSKKPLIITLISVLVVALIAGGTFLFLTLSKPKLDGTYAFSSDGKNASLVVHGKNMTLTFPYLGTVTATISKTSKNVNGGYDYTLGGLQISSDVVENVRYYLYFLDYDMSDSAVKSTLQSLNPVLSVPAGFDKGSPVGTWSISCSAFGASADATVTFNADGSLTASASAMRSLSSRWNGKWTQRDTNSYAITGTDGWDAGTFTIQR